MFTQNQLATLHNLVNKEINNMLQNEVAYNRDVVYEYIKYLHQLKVDIERQQCFTITAVSDLGVCNG